jgi:hypothetical protein
MAGWPSRDGARFMGTWLARSMPNESPAGGRGFRTSDSARMYTSKTGVRRLAELRGLNACVGRGFQAYADLRGETAPPAARSLAWFSPHSSSRASDVSRSTANRSHVFANSSKRSLAMADDEDVANSTQCLACSRHSLGSPGMRASASRISPTPQSIANAGAEFKPLDVWRKKARGLSVQRHLQAPQRQRVRPLPMRSGARWKQMVGGAFSATPLKSEE